VIGMALTRDFERTVVQRVQRDPAFARAMLDEAARCSSAASRAPPDPFCAIW
jgi:hypothetical protein